MSLVMVVNYLPAKEAWKKKQKKKKQGNMRKQQDANNAPPAVQVNLQMCPSVPPEREREREGKRERGGKRERVIEMGDLNR